MREHPLRELISAPIRSLNQPRPCGSDAGRSVGDDVLVTTQLSLNFKIAAKINSKEAGLFVASWDHVQPSP